MKHIGLAILLLSTWEGSSAQFTVVGFSTQTLQEVSTLRTAGKKFSDIPTLAGPFNLLNLDLTLYTTISPVVQGAPFMGGVVLYITEDLFDNDPATIEYLMTFSDTSVSGPSGGVAIYRQDGTELFYGYPAWLRGVYSTPAGVIDAR